MLKKCSNPDCTAPKGLCATHASPEYENCSNWKQKNTKSAIGSTKQRSSKSKELSWTGVELQPTDIGIVSHRGKPSIIGIIGAANAGKTSYLGMLYTLLYNGKRFKNWSFVGSYTLAGWEKLAMYLRLDPNGKVDFPEPTPSNPDFYCLLHLALRNGHDFYDLIFADTSGEVFTQWSKNVDDINVENARWVYKNSSSFIFFVDCEALIKNMGREKQRIVQLAAQVAKDLGGRPITIVWSKADLINDIRENIKLAVERSLDNYFPEADVIEISNYSKDDPDKLCHENNLNVTEFLLDKLNTPKKSNLTPDIGNTSDYFFRYKGSYGSK
ncbi:TRAFAC clade GTPase domain-containing protein [Seonamhaeicola marinus]|uniref:GTPase domain-containing protein n=1 Tax=Seonamhaeicola marinus TaxID=1912246 RepID=A0A5D0HU90_9FLAO|nr:GTPase domain-containing protein [Seonamhaeicola marinus]TYA74934.1 GTPase domain-containing protein [Seonamhaeicola marinus]